MQVVPMRVRGGLAVATIEDRHWVVDTGAPHSFGVGTLTLDNRTIRLDSPSGRYDPGVLSEVAGVPIAGLLGAADLFHEGCTLDAPGGRLILGAPTVPGPGVPCAPGPHWGQRLPILQAQLEGRPVRVAFDTGASVGYVHPDLVPHLGDPVDQVREYMAMTHSWSETPLWQGQLEVAGHRGDYRWGVLPQDCHYLFDLLGMDVLFGGAFLADHSIAFSAAAQRCWVNATQEEMA